MQISQSVSAQNLFLATVTMSSSPPSTSPSFWSASSGVIASAFFLRSARQGPKQ
jgi:hypothetical protein